MAVAHLGALAIVTLLAAPIGIRIGLVLAIALSGLKWAGRRNDLDGDEWALDDDGGCVHVPAHPVEPERFHVVEASSHLLFIRLRLVRKAPPARQLLIWRDTVDRDSFRELHARIEQGRLPVRELPWR